MSSSKDSSLPSALLESLRSIGYTLDTALADIIDNSITAKADNISIRFLWNNGKPWIAVCDDGFGMPPNVLIEAMRFGFRSPGAKRDSEDLGRFGLGMKTASISQCRHLTVVSKSAGKTSACEWNLDAMVSHAASEWNARIVDAQALSRNGILTDLIAKYLAEKETGTIVLWQSLDMSLGDPEESSGEKRFSAHMDSARKHLELVFHRFLAPRRHQRIAIDFNDTQLVAFDPFGPQDSREAGIVFGENHSSRADHQHPTLTYFRTGRRLDRSLNIKGTPARRAICKTKASMSTATDV